MLKNRKEKNFVAWYNEALAAASFIDETAVKGCIAYRPDC